MVRMFHVEQSRLWEMSFFFGIPRRDADLEHLPLTTASYQRNYWGACSRWNTEFMTPCNCGRGPTARLVLALFHVEQLI